MFQGIVISDYEGIDRITTPPHANYTYSLQASILAGLDMVGSSFLSTKNAALICISIIKDNRPLKESSMKDHNLAFT